eukprot:3938627-Rhodomonas_salina.2
MGVRMKARSVVHVCWLGVHTRVSTDTRAWLTRVSGVHTGGQDACARPPLPDGAAAHQLLQVACAFRPEQSLHVYGYASVEWRFCVHSACEGCFVAVPFTEPARLCSSCTNSHLPFGISSQSFQQSAMSKSQC